MDSQFLNNYMTALEEQADIVLLNDYMDNDYEFIEPASMEHWQGMDQEWNNRSDISIFDAIPSGQASNQNNRKLNFIT